MPIEAARAVTGGKTPRQHGAMEYSAAPVDLDVMRRYRLGRLRTREDIAEGLENAPAAFIGLLQGRNKGKQLVRLS